MAYGNNQGRSGGNYRNGNGGGNYRRSGNGGGGGNRRTSGGDGDYGPSVLMFPVDSQNPDAPQYRVIVTLDGGDQMEAGLWAKEGRKGEFWCGPLKPKEEERRDRQSTRRERHEGNRDREFSRGRERDNYGDGNERGGRDEYRSRDYADDAPRDNAPSRERGDPGPEYADARG